MNSSSRDHDQATDGAVPSPTVAHTPGPWRREPGVAQGAWIKGSTGEWVALACGDTPERALANGSLIAAAADLLGACVAFVASEDALLADLRADGELPDLTEKPWTLVDAMRAAIAKATEVPPSSAKPALDAVPGMTSKTGLSK